MRNSIYDLNKNTKKYNVFQFNYIVNKTNLLKIQNLENKMTKIVGKFMKFRARYTLLKIIFHLMAFFKAQMANISTHFQRA